MPLALVGGFQTIRDEFLSQELQTKVRLLNFIPHLPWWGWTILLLIVICIIVLEGAYFKVTADQRAFSEKVADLEAKLKQLHQQLDQRTQRQAERDRVGEVRTKLAIYAQAGQQIIRRCHEASRAKADAPEDEANTWADEVFRYLQSEPALGSDYAVRFESHHGLPMGGTVLLPPYNSVEGYLRTRLARLNEFMKELADLSR